MSEDTLDKDLLLAKVEDKLEDLKFEYGDDELSEVKIFQKLRDIFKDPKYDDALIELGVNKESTGLKKIDSNNNSTSIFNKDEKDINTLVKILLDTSEHIKRIDKRIRGFEEQDDKTWMRKILISIPAIERIKIISFLEAIFLPQNLTAKKNLTINAFESRMNKQLQDIRIRLENYPDHIVKPGTIKYINGILLNEVYVVINAIETGRLGELATDMITGSFNERVEQKPEMNKDEIIKALTKG